MILCFERLEFFFKVKKGEQIAQQYLSFFLTSFNQQPCFYKQNRQAAKYSLEGLVIGTEKKGFDIAKNTPFSACPQYFCRAIQKSWSRKATETISISYANTY